MTLISTRALSVFAAVTVASAVELRGTADNGRSLSGYESPKPTSCFRTLKDLSFTPGVPAGTKVQAKEVGNGSNTMKFVAEDGGELIRLTDEEKAYFAEFHQGKGGVIALRFKFPDMAWGPFKQCSGNTPIGLDIDASGSVERIEGNFFIDISGDGDIEHLHEWFAPTEGILIDAALATKDGVVSAEHFAGSVAVTDSRALLKHSGAITGKHLFGDMGSLFADGFEKLTVHDGNKDGSVMGSELEGLAVWVDANSNAKVDAGELNSLASYGIVGLNTSHNNFVSSAKLMDGSTMVTEDLWFSR